MCTRSMPTPEELLRMRAELDASYAREEASQKVEPCSGDAEQRDGRAEREAA